MPVPLEDVRIVVELGGLAPSVHNTQPWRFRWDGTALALREDATRALPVLDPHGRARTLSCGAALLHVRMGFAEIGWGTTTDLLPDGPDGETLARVTVTARRPASPEEHELAVAAPRRATDRDPYDDRPLPADLLGALADAARTEGARLHVLDRPEQRAALAGLLSRADAVQRSDQAYLDELAAWRTRAAAATGVPDSAVAHAAPRPDRLQTRDFDARAPGEPAPSAAPADPTLLLLTTDGDTRRDWALAGQAVARVLLRAATDDVAAQPVTSVVEVPETRAELAPALGLSGVPQMVLRAGFGSGGPVSHRLPVDDVLDVVAPAG